MSEAHSLLDTALASAGPDANQRALISLQLTLVRVHLAEGNMDAAQALLADSRVPSLVKFLKDTAAYANPKRFAKAPRGPKKPPPKRTGGLREKHVSTHRLLLNRRPARLATTL